MAIYLNFVHRPFPGIVPSRSIGYLGVLSSQGLPGRNLIFHIVVEDGTQLTTC